MVCFNMELADIPFEVKCIFETTRTFCQDYLSSKKSLFSIEITQSDIDNERKNSAKQNIREGINIINYSDSYLETLALYRKALIELINYDIVLFHSCIIVKDDVAYAFTAPSGTGKTTHANLWLKNIDGSYILNGDKPLVRIKNDEVVAYGTPWMGKENLGVAESKYLKAICLLCRGKENKIEKVNATSIFPELLVQFHRDFDVDGTKKALQTITKILSNVTTYRLYCNMDDEAAIVAYNGMK